MSSIIEIRAIDPATFNEIHVHRFRNFGEDVYRLLKDTCSVSLDEIDRTTTHFSVRDIRRRDLGTVTQKIKELLVRHHLEEALMLVRL
jgi:hypothetical protein